MTTRSARGTRWDLGIGTVISGDVKVSPGVTLELGNDVCISPGVRIVGKGIVRFGDYSKIHAGCFISVPEPDSVVEFGCNTWIGERSVLDGRGGLHASHNVGVGIASHLYSHIAHGDTMGGCRFKSEKPLIIGNDAWFVGQCLVSPVNVGEKSMAMLGSTITRDMEPNTIYAGVPAKDMTEKMGRPWEERPLGERLNMFNEHLQTYMRETGQYDLPIVGVTEFPAMRDSSITYFNVATRTYTKRTTYEERNFMRWFTSWRGRFLPEGGTK